MKKELYKYALEELKKDVEAIEREAAENMALERQRSENLYHLLQRVAEDRDALRANIIEMGVRLKNYGFAKFWIACGLFASMYMFANNKVFRYLENVPYLTLAQEWSIFVLLGVLIGWRLGKGPPRVNKHFELMHKFDKPDDLEFWRSAQQSVPFDTYWPAIHTSGGAVWMNGRIDHTKTKLSNYEGKCFHQSCQDNLEGKIIDSDGWVHRKGMATRD